MRALALFLASLCLAFCADMQNLTRLAADGKGMVLIFESKDCGYCEILKNDFEKDERLLNLVGDFNIYLIDINEDKSYIFANDKRAKSTKELKYYLYVNSAPCVMIFDKDYNKIFAFQGYADPQQMSVFMKFVKGLNEGKYKASQWQKFLNENGVL